MSENGKLIAKKPKNNNVANGNINFSGIIEGAKKIEKEKSDKFYADMQKMAAEEKARAESIENLFLKAHEKKQEERKKQMEKEQKAAEEKAKEKIREQYRAESRQEWNERATDKAYKTLLKDLNK